MLLTELTQKEGVQTSEGFIPHRAHPENGIDMPVLVRFALQEDRRGGRHMAHYPVPDRHPATGTLMYATPGGGVWFPKLPIL